MPIENPASFQPASSFADDERQASIPDASASSSPTCPSDSTYTVMRMHSLEADLEAVEQQLDLGGGGATTSDERTDAPSSFWSPTPAVAGGNAFFQSIRSALTSIRHRLEELQQHPLQNDCTTLDPTSTTSVAALAGHHHQVANEDATAASTAAATQQQQQQQALTTRTASSAAATTHFGEQLMERLRNAELAHSNRIPLHMLRSRQQQQQQSSANLVGASGADRAISSNSSSSSRFGGSTKRDREEGKEQSNAAAAAGKTEPETDNNNNTDDMEITEHSRDMEYDSNQQLLPSPRTALRQQQRRESIMVASRRRLNEAEGPHVDQDLHGTVAASMLLGRSIHSFGDTVEVVMEGANEEVNDDHGDDEPEQSDDVPTILLSRKSHSKLDLAQRSVLFPETAKKRSGAKTSTTTSSSSGSSGASLMETDNPPPTAKPSTVVYSWGSGVNSLHTRSADQMEENDSIPVTAARVDSTSRAGRADIVSCSIGKFHTGCVTAAGELLLCGSNLSGQVDPDRREETVMAKPVLLESLLAFRATIVQVSCGAHHTAALRSDGTVLTWGSNEYGELGHRAIGRSSDQLDSTAHQPAPPALFVKPAVMALGLGHRATLVACGDGFTLCLTSRMNLLACGVSDLTGCDVERRRLPSSIPALEDLPLVSMAAGRRHAVVVTAHGSVYVWGDNTKGQCGREYPPKLSVPVPFRTPPSCTTSDQLPRGGKMLREPLTNWIYLNADECNADQQHQQQPTKLSDDVAVVHATCGEDHTVLVTRAGGLLVCGSNECSQIGAFNMQDADGGEASNKMVYHPQRVEHPDKKRMFKKAEAGESHTLLLDDLGDVWQLGSEEGKTTVELHQVFTAKMIQSIAAGGRQSVAVADASTMPSRGPLRREYSDQVMTKDGDLALADSLEEVILTVSTEDDKPEYNSTIVKRAEELFRSPAVLNSLFLDPSELEDIFSKLLNVDTPNFRKRIASAIEKGMYKGLENLRTDDARLMWPEQVRFLLLYIQCPLFVEWKTEDSIFDRRGDLILALCETILELNYEGYKALMAWATSIYPREQFVRYLVRPLLSQLKKGLSVEAGAERRPIPAIVSVLRWLYNASERDGDIAEPEDFYSDAVSNIHPEALLQDLQRYKAATKQGRSAEFFFCDNSFLLSPSAKRNLLQIENEFNMLKVASRGLTYNAQERTFEFNPYYVMDIDREHMLTQTLQKLSKADPNDLRKKLRVVFKGEDGVDAGGVTREFFQLLCSQLFDVLTGMWVHGGSVTWFNSNCSWNDEGFFLSGILVGLAVYNGVLLDVLFPQAVYRKLLGLPLGFEDLFDEELKSGLRKLLDYEGDDVEDIFCLTFDVAWMDLGVEKRRDLKPNGSSIPVTADNKEEYVMLYVRWLLVDSIYPQYESFEAGFLRVMEDSTLDLLRPDDLELLVVGSPELDFAALEANTEYDGGFTADSPAIRNFWRFVHHSPRELQLDLLKFATGSTKAPIGGLGKMNFKIQRAGPDSDHLPTSHTCFNTLLLPDYGDNFEKLNERLSRAIVECEGFGLQ